MYSNALSIYRPQIGPKLHLKAEIFTKIGTNIIQNYVCLVGPLFIDTALDKTHYSLKDATGLLSDGTYHVNQIKKGSVHTHKV